MTTPTLLNAHRDSKKTGKPVTYAPNVSVEFPNLKNKDETDKEYKDVEDFSFGPLKDTSISVDPSQVKDIELSQDELNFMTKTGSTTTETSKAPLDSKSDSNIEVSDKDVTQFTEGEPGYFGQAVDAAAEYFSPKKALNYLENRPYYGGERIVGIPSYGLVRGLAGVSWFADAAVTYTAGTLENAARAAAGSFGFGEGWVDYDKTWFGKNAFGLANKGFEDLARYMKKNLDINDMHVAEKAAMYSAEFLVALTPTTVVKSVLQSGKEVLGYIGGAATVFKSFVPNVMKADKIQKTITINAAKSRPATQVSTIREQAALEKKLIPDLEKLAVAKGGRKIAGLGGTLTPRADYNVAKITARIEGQRAQLSSDLIKKIKIGSKGRLKVNKFGDGRFSYSITVPQVDEVVTLSTKKYAGRDPATNLPVYTDKVYIKKFPSDPTNFKKMYHQLQYAEIATGVGVAVAATEHMLKGTGLEDYKFLGGFLAAFTTPSAMSSVVEKIVDGFQSRAQTLSMPVGGILGKIPGTDRDMPLSMPSLLMLGAILTHKGLEAARGTGRDTGDIIRSLVDSDEFYDRPFIQRIVAASAGIPFYKAMLPRTILKKEGKPESGIDIGGLDNTLPLRNSEGEILYRRNAAGQKVPQTEFSAAIALRDQNRNALARFADLMEDQLDPSDLDTIKKLYSQSEKLHEQLNKMNAGDGFELFNAAIEQINLAIINQNMAGMLTRSITDLSYRSKLFGGSKIADSFESGAIYNMMLTQTREVDANLNFVKEAIKDLTGTYPQLQNQFKTLFENIKGVSNTINKQKEDLNNYAEKFAKDSRQALSVDENILIDEIQNAAKGEGNGLGLTAKFGRNGEQREAGKIRHANEFMATLKTGRDNLNNVKTDAYNEVKNNPSSATAQKLQNITSADTFIQQLEKSNDLRQINVSRSEGGINLGTVIGDWAEYGGKQDPQDFIGSLKAYTKWKGLTGANFSDLEGRALELARYQANGKLTVALPEVNFKLGEVSHKLKYTTDDAGGVDLARTLQDIDEHATGLVSNDLQKSKEVYLRRLLSLLKSNDSLEAQTRDLGSKAILDEVVPSSFALRDMVSLESSLSTYIHNNKVAPKGVSLIPSKKQIEKILIKNGIEESKIAKQLNVLLKESYDNKNMEFLTTPYGQGKHTKTPFELFDTLLTKPAEEIIPVLEKMSSSFKDINGVKQNINQSIKGKIQTHLDDQIGLNILQNPHLIDKNFDNITKLREAGYVSEHTYSVVSRFVKRMEELKIQRNLLQNFDQVEKSFMTKVQKLVRQVEDAEKKSILGDLENAKDLSKVYDFLLAARINIASKPKIDVDSTKNFEGIDSAQDDMLNIANELTKRQNVETILKQNPQIELNSKEFKNILEQLNPQHIRDIQSTRIDTLLETVFKIKPNSTAETITKDQKDNIEGLVKLMVAEAAQRSVKVTNTRQSAFGPKDSISDSISRKEKVAPFSTGSAKVEKRYKQEVNDSFFGLATDLDIKQFGESMVELSPLFDKVFPLLGKNKIEQNLNNLFKATVLLKAQGPDVANAMAKLGSLNYKLTAPAALSRIYAGMRGVVSWRYLASEQIIREHQANKARLLASIFTDPTFAKNLADFVEGRKLTKEQSEQMRKQIRLMTGAKLVYYNEDEAGNATMLYDDEISDKQLYDGFVNGVAEYLYKKSGFLRTDDSYSEPPASPQNVPKEPISTNMTADDLY